MTYCPEGDCDESECPECLYWTGWRTGLAILVGASLLASPLVLAFLVAALASRV